ncbi:hypothetical protein [Tautonia sociabilis]|uniref:Uncharacterized protein n=1 Tax=Tautonia sociabilis TaxID=2080755 RepID=A0A432MQB8_9BACT|nr:hypothetical protein [Tautonia sociabilis]RUL89439.1 hypothetical protein TsocGM_01315 [Tautonia sociabilis]
MSDSVLKRYTNPRAAFVQRGEQPDEEEGLTDDLGCYGWLRGMRERSPMLEFRRKDGRSLAYDYALLRKVEFDPSEGITLHFDGEIARIEGRNLGDELTPGIQLLRGILNHRVPWVRELGEADLLAAAEDTLVIERFDFIEAR